MLKRQKNQYLYDYRRKLPSLVLMRVIPDFKKNHIYDQNIFCGYSKELSHDSSFEYPENTF